MIVDGILQRERAARVVAFQTRLPDPLTLGEVIDALSKDWSSSSAGSAKFEALKRVAQRSVVDRLMLLAADKEAAPEVRSLVELKNGLPARSGARARFLGRRAAARALDEHRVRPQPLDREAGAAVAHTCASCAPRRPIRHREIAGAGIRLGMLRGVAMGERRSSNRVRILLSSPRHCPSLD